MPDNPNAQTVIKNAQAAQAAQRKLRDAMAAVAASVRTAPPNGPGRAVAP